MNRHQRRIVANFVIVIAGTILAVLGMIELKNWVNRSEAMRAMEQLGRTVADYKQKNGSVPPESYVEGIRESLEGQVRAGGWQYRARWIQFDSPPEEILCYVRKDYRSFFFRPGAIVLRFDGRVEWMDKEGFDRVLASQQSPTEVEMTPR